MGFVTLLDSSAVELLDGSAKLKFELDQSISNCQVGSTIRIHFILSKSLQVRVTVVEPIWFGE